MEVQIERGKTLIIRLDEIGEPDIDGNRVLFFNLNGQRREVLVKDASIDVYKRQCYQLPALLLDNLTLVISPLISLMKDQVDALNLMGIPATYINSTISYQEMNHRIQLAVNKEVKLLYVAPERLE